MMSMGIGNRQPSGSRRGGSGADRNKLGNVKGCPGSSLDSCVELCPGLRCHEEKVSLELVGF